MADVEKGKGINLHKMGTRVTHSSHAMTPLFLSSFL